MKQCLKCGYEDSACWRAGAHMCYSGMEICRLSELFDWEPDLAKRIKELRKGEVLVDNFNAYKLTKKGWVYRQPLFLYKVAPFKRPDWERYKKPLPLGQTKLLEVANQK